MKIKKTTVKVNGGSMYLITFDSLNAQELLECYKLMNIFEERIRYEERTPDVLDITTVIYSSEAETWLNMLFRCVIGCGEEIQIAQLKE